MIRMQIQLDEAEARRLKELAKRKGTSVASVVREAVAKYGADDDLDAKWERALSVVGKYHSGRNDVAENHDKYLDEIYGDW